VAAPLDAGITTESPRLLFIRAQGDCFADLYSVQADGSGLKRLTRNRSTFAGTWSPDGRSIALERREGHCDYHDFVPFNLFVMNADGSHVRRLTRDGDSRRPLFSPDGMRLTFERELAVIVSDRDAKHVRVIAKGSHGTWSPDGKHLIYSRLNELAIWVFDVTTGRKRHLAGGRGDFVLAPDWSPDGTRLVFPRELQRLGRTKYELWLMRSDGSGKKRLTDQAAGVNEDGGPSWSPDGRQIAFVRSSDSGYALMVITPEGSERTVTKGSYIGSFQWSRDGSLIAFSGNRGLWVIRPDGTRPLRLTRNGQDEFPTWQP
jgi:Tol biopolymer transport system component